MNRISVLALVVAASCASDLDLAEDDQAVVTTPQTGGPYASGPTKNTGPQVTSPAAALPFMDQAAKNWGCDWNLGAHAVVSLAGSNFSKAYGTLADPAQGCGIVYWNSSQQTAFFVANAGGAANVANQLYGATTYASSSYSSGTPASSVNDGNRKGNPWGSGGGWSSSAPATAAAPQIITVQFNQLRTINAIDVVTLQDSYGVPIEPTTSTTFAQYGIQNFLVQYYNNGVWTTVATVTGNNHVLRHFTFAPVAATHVRVWITQAADGYARVVELSAYDASAPMTSGMMLARYNQLGAETSVLGVPVSNPVPYTGNGVTYQLFTNGVMTFKRGAAAAHFVGGVIAADPVTHAPAFDDRPLAAAWQRMFHAYATSSGSPIAYALASDAGCTSSAANPTECSAASTGRYALYSDDYWNGNGFFVGKLGSANAFALSVPVASHLPTYPWTGAHGFPTADIANFGATAEYQQQAFERGFVSWAPGFTTTGASSLCPDPISNCSGAPGQAGCPVVYGTRYTNYLVQDDVPAWNPSCTTYATVEGNPLLPSTGDVQYYIPPGSYQDFPLGAFQAGTTLEFGNCHGGSANGQTTLSLYKNGALVTTTTGGCAGNSGLVYTTFSSRLGTEQWTVRLSCAGGGYGALACTNVAHLQSRYDFNGDLVDVLRAYNAVPNRSTSSSVIGMLDAHGDFTDPNYGCSCHDDHPEGIIRLPNNRFAVTTDFGLNGKLYVFDIQSKPIDDAHRLGTNVVNNEVPDIDSLAQYNYSIGNTRGHLGGATRSGVYLLTAAEADNDSVNGQINVIDASGDVLRDVNHYTNQLLLGNNDGAAWVTSAKLGTGSSDKSAINYIPAELQNAHLILSAGTNMATINAVYAPRDAGGLSTLTTEGRKGPGDNFVPFATVPAYSGGDNQATLLTQADGQVFLMTLNGETGTGGTGACEDSTRGYSKLYKVKFAGCPNNARICFDVTGGNGGINRRDFETYPTSDMVRAAGTWL
ncbi:MAG TPA: discoidin domain-containing protein, partial [Kofleriaceae bacterium]